MTAVVMTAVVMTAVACPHGEDMPVPTVRTPAWRRGVPGTVYLLCFRNADGTKAWFGHAGHYTGFAGGGARGLARRLAKHDAGRGARLLAAALGAGITWELARTWPGTRARERQLKRQGGASRRCPLCGVTPRPGDLPTNADGSISRSRTTDAQKAAAGVMTSAQQADHTALRRGAARGRVSGAVRLTQIPADDPWYATAPASAAVAEGVAV
jgi:hypothetical protein